MAPFAQMSQALYDTWHTTRMNRRTDAKILASAPVPPTPPPNLVVVACKAFGVEVRGTVVH
eukprot:1148011-Pelagomonas_calceolata.AAC.9